VDPDPVRELLARAVAVCERRYRRLAGLPREDVAGDDVDAAELALIAAQLELARHDAGRPTR
jgi:hypothetical protein